MRINEIIDGYDKDPMERTAEVENTIHKSPENSKTKELIDGNYNLGQIRENVVIYNLKNLSRSKYPLTSTASPL